MIAVFANAFAAAPLAAKASGAGFSLDEWMEEAGASARRDRRRPARSQEAATPTDDKANPAAD